MFRKIILLVAVITGLISCNINDVFGAPISSNGTTGGNWNTPATWAGGVVPGAGDDVTIVDGDQVTVDVSVSCLSLTIQSDGSVNGFATLVVGAFTLTVIGNIDLSSINVGGASTIQTTLNSAASILNAQGDINLNALDGAETPSLIIPNISILNISGNINITSTNPTTTFGITSTVNYNGTGAQTIIATNYGTLQSSSTGGRTLDPGGIIAIKRNTTTCFVPGTNTYTITSSSIEFSGGGSQTIPVFNYNDLRVGSAGTKTFANGTIGVAGTLSLLGTNSYAVGSSTINFNGSNQTIPIVAGRATSTYNNINVNCSGSGATLAAAVTSTVVVGNVTVQTGTLNNGGFAIDGAATKTFTVDNGAFFVLTGSSGMPTGFAGAGTPVLGATSTVDYNGSGSQTIAAANYGNLTSSNTGARTLASSGVIGIATTFTPGTNVYTVTGSTINFNGSGNQSVPMPATALYNDIQITCTGGTGATLAAAVSTTNVAGNITVLNTGKLNNGGFAMVGNGSATFQVNNGGTFTLSGTTSAMPTGFGTTTLGITSTVDFNGTGAQTIPAINFGHLTSSSTGGRTLASSGTIGISGVFTTGTNTYTTTTSTVDFMAAGAQTIPPLPSPANYININVSGSGTKSLSGATNLVGVLTISAGTFDVNGQTFTLISDANGTASIAEITGGGAGPNITGNITMQRYTTGPTEWRFLCSAVSGRTIGDWTDDFATSGFTGATCAPSDCSGGCAATCNVPSIYTYDETVLGTSDNGFVAATNTTNSINQGNWVYLGTNPLTFDVTGPPNKFAQSPVITFTASDGSDHDGWNQIANPYPSAISWDDVDWTKTNVDPTIYIYASNGSYASYVGNGSCTGASVNGGSCYIASQQSFWVKANAAGPAISMTEGVKAAAQNPTFLRIANSPNTSKFPMAFKDFPVTPNANNNPNSILFTASGNGLDDEMLIRFMNGPTDDFDSQYDAWKLLNASHVHNLSSVIAGDKNLAINSLPALSSEVAIPIRLTIPAGTGTATYSIRRDSVLMLPTTSCIILEDKATGSMIDLRTTITYTFSIADTTVAPRFILHVYPSATTSAVNATCAGGTNGLAIAKGVGVGPWNYVWKNSAGTVLKTTIGSSTADTLFNCPAGTYSVTFNGSFCGAVTDTIVVSAPPALGSTLTHVDVSCFGANDGSATISPSGGTPSYDYLWCNGQTTSAAVNLSIGNCSVTITDANGCVSSATVTISQPDVLLTPVLHTNVSCFGGNNGSASVSATGGTLPYTYLWGNGQSTSAAANLSLGNYSLTITDANGCASSASVSITEPAALINTVSLSNVSCFGMSDGSATALPSGGTLPYSYLWNNGQSTSTAANLSFGNYSVKITDLNGCTFSSYVSIAQPPLLTAGYTASTYTVDIAINNSVTFTNTSSGAISYQWDFGDASTISTSVNPTHAYSVTGTYTVMLISSDGPCSDTAYNTIVVIDSNPTALNPSQYSSMVNVAYENGEVFLLFSLDKATRVNISVYNMLGERILFQNDLLVKNDRIKLEFPSSSAGIYIALSELSDARVSKKIILPVR